MTERRRTGLVLTGWALALAATIAWGTWLRHERPDIKVGAAPFFGRWGPEVGSWPALVGAALLGAAAVAVAPRIVPALSWRRLLAVLAATAAVWLVALSMVGGPEDLAAPLRDRNEYLAGVDDVTAAGGPSDFLDGFTDDMAGYPIHVQGHPPGVVLALWAVDDSGLDAEPVAVATVVVAWASVAVSAAVALRATAGEDAARHAAPFLALAPGAVWAGTSLDGLFAGVVGAGIALVVVATHGRGRRAVVQAVAGGALVGVALLLSYSVVPVLAVPTAVAVRMRRPASLLAAAATAAAVLVAAGLGGFWWFDGLAATRDRYHDGVADLRPLSYFVLANLVLVSVAAGPAAVVALVESGRRLLGPGVLALGALVGVVVADVSGLSKGEVERIWLPFVPWLLTATGVVAARAGRARALLGLQVAVGLAAQVAVRSPW